jgi:succinate dehydrogenase/fumarate reductase iron-sulfur protein
MIPSSVPPRTINISVRRFDPSRDKEPRFKTYTIPHTPQMRVLEALDYIVETLGESLAYRWFCGIRRCGMCGMQINGKPRLACWEAVQADMVIEPLANFPVVRDLVIDRARYDRNVMALEPWLQRRTDYPGLPEPLQTTAMATTATMSHCIECLLCVSACPAESTQFLGPAPLVQLAKYAFDTRDGGARARAALDVAGIENCVSCYQCSASCPLDIPILEQAIGGLNARIEEEGIARPKSLRSWLMGHVHSLSKVASSCATGANALGRSKLVRSLLERIVGIDRRRPLPSLARVSFAKWFKSRVRLRNDSKRVVIFHDTFMSYYEPEIGIAATELLEAAGYEVILIQKRKCCGRPLISERMLDSAKALAEHNIALLLPYAEQGISIIGCEPSCLLTLKEEYPRLCPGTQAKILAAQCLLLEDFLAREANAGTLDLEFTDKARRVLFHGHCHQRYFLESGSALQALHLPLNFQVEETAATCCGMAGANGFYKERYERSLQAAEVSLLPAVRRATFDTEIAACGISCRQQIQHGTGRVARHPAVILREALIGTRSAKAPPGGASFDSRSRKGTDEI